METILVPLDGSARAAHVLPYVRLLAQALGARVLLLQVLPPEEDFHVHAPRMLGAHAEPARASTATARYNPVCRELERRAATYLARHATALRRAGLDVAIEVCSGCPAEAIGAIAEQRQAGLVALTLHGASRMRRGLSGSVAEQVLRACAAPLLIVPAEPPRGEPELRRILVPLDGSRAARRALPFALRLAAASAATLILAHMVAPPLVAAPDALLPQPIQDAWSASADEALQAVAAGIRTPQVPVTTTTLVGNAAEGIVAAAQQQHADMIVMTTHGSGGRRRWLLGSVTEKVLHTARLPLVLVHANAVHRR